MTTLTVDDTTLLYRVAGEAMCDPRTVRRFVTDRRRVSKLAARAIADACERLKIATPPTKEKRAKR